MSSSRAVLLTFVLFNLLPHSAFAQGRSSGSVLLSADLSLMPALRTFGVEADARVWSGISATASFRRMGAGNVACIESSPSPCSPEGLSLAVGVRLAAESRNGWWPYAEAAYGRYRYLSHSDWKPHFTAGAGVGFHVGSRGAVRIGFIYGRIPADPPQLEAWRTPGEDYVHTVGGLLVGAGVQVW